MILRVESPVPYSEWDRGIGEDDCVLRQVALALRRATGMRPQIWMSHGTVLAGSSIGVVETTKHTVCRVHHKGANVLGDVIITWPR